MISSGGREDLRSSHQSSALCKGLDSVCRVVEPARAYLSASRNQQRPGKSTEKFSPTHISRAPAAGAPVLPLPSDSDPSGVPMDLFTQEAVGGIGGLGSAGTTSLADLGDDFPKVTFDTCSDHLGGFQFFDASVPTTPSPSSSIIDADEGAGDSSCPRSPPPPYRLSLDHASYSHMLLPTSVVVDEPSTTKPTLTLVVTDDAPTSSIADSPRGKSPLVSAATSSGCISDRICKPESSAFAADSNSSSGHKSFVPCRVCGDKASGYHYGVTSCEGCKGFFRRSIQKQIEYRCLRDGKCLVIRLNRNRCQYCRFKKCLAVGMSRDSVRYGRVPKRCREKADQEGRGLSSDDDQSRDEESKQLAIYDVILTVSQAHHAHCQYVEEATRDLDRQPATFDFGSQTSNIDGASSSVETAERRRICLWQTFATLLTPSIQRVVEIAKRIPGFLELSQDDQLILIKASFFEVWLVHASRLITPADGRITFPDGQYITKSHLDAMFNDEFSSGVFVFSSAVNALCLNDTEVALLSAVTLMTSDRAGVSNHKLVNANRERLLEALKIQLARNHVSEQSLFGRLVQKLPELGALGRRHAEQLSWYRQLSCPLQLPALFAEMFDIPLREDTVMSSQP